MRDGVWWHRVLPEEDTSVDLFCVVAGVDIVIYRPDSAGDAAEDAPRIVLTEIGRFSVSTQVTTIAVRGDALCVGTVSGLAVFVVSAPAFVFLGPNRIDELRNGRTTQVLDTKL